MSQKPRLRELSFEGLAYIYYKKKLHRNKNDIKSSQTTNGDYCKGKFCLCSSSQLYFIGGQAGRAWHRLAIPPSPPVIYNNIIWESFDSKIFAAKFCF